MKRACETTITTTANKRTRSMSEIAEMYLNFYEEAILKARENVSCHPTVFIHRYISIIENWRELLEGEAPKTERIALLISRNRELNYAARSAWQKRYDEMQAPSSVPYFFVRPDGYDDYRELMTPVGQLGLLSHITDRPELVPQLQAWLDHRTAFHYEKLTASQRSALIQYSFNSYKEVWKAFEDNAIESNETAKEIADVFEAVRADPEHSSLPMGACLFEGQGHHVGEDDILRLRLTEDQLPHSMTTRRPHSTSLVPNVGIHYATMGTIYPGLETEILRWQSHRHDFDSVERWALYNGRAKASGCLIRYYVRAPVAAIPSWVSSHVRAEAEVMLPAGTKLTVFKIERGVELVDRRAGDPIYHGRMIRYDVHHVNIE